MIIFLLLFGSLLASADPECDYNFNISNAVILLTDGQQVIEQDMTVLRDRNSPSGRCENFRVFFNKGQANSYQRKAFNSQKDSINYNLHRQPNLNGVLKDFTDALNFNEYVEGTAHSRGVVYKHNFFISAPGLNAQGSPASGSYTDQVQASIYGFNPNSGKYLFEETRSFALTFLVSKKIEISLINEGSKFDPTMTHKILDFGYLEQFEEKGVDLRVVANTPYQVKVSSFNNGFLKRSQASTIAYSIKVNGSSIGLSNSASTPVHMGGSGASRTSAAGDLYNLKIKITGSPIGKAPGLYQDMMTITAIAN